MTDWDVKWKRKCWLSRALAHWFPKCGLWTISINSMWKSGVCMHVSRFNCLTLCSPLDCSLPGSSVLGSSRQEYWSGLPFFSSRRSSQTRVQTSISMFPALAGEFFTMSATWEAPREMVKMTVMSFPRLAASETRGLGGFKPCVLKSSTSDFNMV